MSVLPTQSNTLTIAKESLAMSEKTGDKNFHRMAIGFMALTGLGTLLHAVHEIYRDMQPRRAKDRPAPAADAARPAGPLEQVSLHHEAVPAESWVQRTRPGDRQAEGDRVWTEAIARQAKGGRHEK